MPSLQLLPLRQLQQHLALLALLALMPTWRVFLAIQFSSAAWIAALVAKVLMVLQAHPHALLKAPTPSTSPVLAPACVFHQAHWRLTGKE